MKKLLIVLAISVLMSACTDTDMASIGAYGKEGDIICYSGGKEIFKGHATGRIQTVDRSDGWEFKDDKTNKFVRVSGDCVITN